MQEINAKTANGILGTLILGLELYDLSEDFQKNKWSRQMSVLKTALPSASLPARRCSAEGRVQSRSNGGPGYLVSFGRFWAFFSFQNDWKKLRKAMRKIHIGFNDIRPRSSRIQSAFTMHFHLERPLSTTTGLSRSDYYFCKENLKSWTVIVSLKIETKSANRVVRCYSQKE